MLAVFSGLPICDCPFGSLWHLLIEFVVMHDEKDPTSLFIISFASEYSSRNVLRYQKGNQDYVFITTLFVHQLYVRVNILHVDNIYMGVSLNSICWDSSNYFNFCHLFYWNASSMHQARTVGSRVYMLQVLVWHPVLQISDGNLNWFNPPFLLKCLYQVRVITFFPVFRLLTDVVCLYTNGF